MRPILRLLALLVLGALPLAHPADTPADERVRTVAIVLFPGVELLDFAGPGEVFAVTSNDAGRAFRVVTVARSREPLLSMRFLELRPTYTFADCPAPDVVVMPGGAVPYEDSALRDWLRACAGEAELMMSVCNGAIAFGAAGLLDGREVTTHHGVLERLADLVPQARVLANRRFVDEGTVLTGAGISAGIDASLHVVARLLGEESAWRTAEFMEYDWRPDEIAAQHARPGEVVGRSAAAALAERVRREGVEAVATALASATEPEAIPAERALLNLAYAQLRSEQTDDALALFRLMERFYATSPNASDSLAEALERLGDPEAARAANERALARLEVTPGTDPARRARLENAVHSRQARLTGDADALRFGCSPCGRACDDFAYLRATRCPGCPMDLVPLADLARPIEARADPLER